MSIDLESVNSGYNLSTINTNFSTIETYINDNVLHRKGNVAGEALMTRDLDMNGYSILNADIDTSNFTNDRAIRVPTSEGTIAALPIASERAGKILSFSPVDGLPIVTAPVSGSAVDVLNQLALGTGSTLVGYKLSPAATSVTRVVRDKLDEYVSVRDFGAKGDGSTDDTAAIQACFTWAQSYGRGVHIHFPIGTYILSSRLTIDGGSAQLFLEGANSGTVTLSWKNTSTSHGILAGANTPISRFQIKGMTLVTNIVNAFAAVRITFNHTSPKSFIAEEVSAYGGGSGGTPSAGYFGGGLFDLIDPVYPFMKDCTFTGIASLANNGLIFAGFNITSVNAAVLITNMLNCNVTGAGAGLQLNTQSVPGIEGTFLTNCNFGFCNVGLTANATSSGNTGYYPPQIFIQNCQIEYYQIGISINHHSVVNIANCLLYADSSSPSPTAHVVLNNTLDSVVHDCYMESRPGNTSMAGGVIVQGNSANVKVHDNIIQVPAATNAVLFSDTASQCRQYNNRVKQGLAYANISSNAGTNSQVEYNSGGQVSTNLQEGMIIKAGSSVLTLGAGGTFTIAFTQGFPTTNISTVVSNGDINSSMANVVISGRNNSGFSGTFIGASSGTTVRVNFYAIGV